MNVWELVVRLSGDGGDLRRDIAEDKAALEELNATHLSDKHINVDADTAEADAKLAATREAVGRIPDKKTVRIETAGSPLLGSILTALPAIAPIAATASAGVMGLASAFVAAGAGSAGLMAVAIPTLKTIFEAAGKGAQGMAGLDAQQRAAVQSLQQFQAFWQGFQKSFETPVLSMFTEGLRMLQQLLTNLRPAIQAAAEAFTQLEREAAQGLGGPFWQQFFGYLGGSAKQAILDFGHAIGNLVTGFAALMMAFQPLSTSMSQGLVNLTARFAQWAQQLGSSQGFQQFVQYVQTNGPLVVQVIGNLATIIGQLLVAMAPFGQAFLQAAVAVTNFVKDLFQAHPGLATLTVAALQGIGVFKLFASAVGGIANAVRSVVGVFNTLRTAFTVLRTAMNLTSLVGLVTNPVGLIIAAVALLAAAAYLIITHWQGIKEFFASLWNGVVQAFQAFWAWLQGFFAQWGPVILAILMPFIGIPLLIVQHWQQITGFLSQIWGSIQSTASSIWNSIVSTIQNLWSGFVSWIQNAAQSLANGVVQAFEWLYNHNYYFQDLVDAISKAWDAIKNTTSQVWEAVKTFLDNLWNGIKSAATTMWQAISTAIGNGWKAISDATNTVWNAIKGFLSSVWQGISSTASSVWNAIKSAVTGPIQQAQGILSSAWNAISSAASSAWNSILSTIRGIAQSIGSALSGLASQAYQWGANLINGFVDGIQSMAGRVANAASNVAQKAARFLGFHSPAEEGPGSDADKWAPNLMNMLTEGIKAGTPKLQAALSQVFLPPKVSAMVQSGVTGSAAAVAGSAATGGQQIVYNQHAPQVHIERLSVRNDGDIRKLQQIIYWGNERMLRSLGVAGR